MLTLGEPGVTLKGERSGGSTARCSPSTSFYSKGRHRPVVAERCLLYQMPGSESYVHPTWVTATGRS